MLIKELDINISDLIKEFVNDEQELFEVDVSEQAISNRLARKLEAVAEGWNVDCEYNREMHTIKKLKYALEKNGDIVRRNVVPDIIIHQRKTSKNLLAVEVKKVANRENRFKDKSKLKAFREQLGYRYTLFVDFDTGKKPIVANIEFQINE